MDKDGYDREGFNKEGYSRCADMLTGVTHS